jgi:hypothetical protein
MYSSMDLLCSTLLKSFGFVFTETVSDDLQKYRMYVD